MVRQLLLVASSRASLLTSAALLVASAARMLAASAATEVSSADTEMDAGCLAVNSMSCRYSSTCLGLKKDKISTLYPIIIKITLFYYADGNVTLLKMWYNSHPRWSCTGLCWVDLDHLSTIQGVTRRCRLSWLTNSALVFEPKCGGGELRGHSQ
jgi:hypothetical protein